MVKEVLFLVQPDGVSILDGVYSEMEINGKNNHENFIPDESPQGPKMLDIYMCVGGNGV